MGDDAMFECRTCGERLPPERVYQDLDGAWWHTVPLKDDRGREVGRMLCGPAERCDDEDEWEV